MTATTDKKIFPLGLVLFALALAAYKAIMLALEIGAGWQTLLVLLGLDLFFIALLLLTAMLGGFLLNLTPCVLPVIPIKIMSLGNVAGSRRRTLLLGSVMSLGVIFFWLALGFLISSVSAFTATNQLFQFPLFL